jgi:predicted ABC-type ATPase
MSEKKIVIIAGPNSAGKTTLEQAKDPDMAGSADAMRRASIRARHVAAQTGTALIVWRDGKIQREMVMDQNSLPKRADG